MITEKYLRFDGNIFVTTETSPKFGEIINFLNQQTVLGFDTETRPSFKKGRTNKPALIQFATKELAVLYQIRNHTIAKEILHILENNKIIKVGSGVSQDLKQLQQLASFTPQSFIDIQGLAKKAAIENLSLKKLSKQILGMNISKRQQLSNWENYELTEAQKVYAATDAYACLLIYEKLLHETS